MKRTPVIIQQISLINLLIQGKLKYCAYEHANEYKTNEI